ncbi:MAG TPA: leucine--tRNA ligase [bacterium]|nr:leucine--tRNA ligase [bacterium]
MREYNFEKFEAEWRQKWEAQGLHTCDDNDPRQKYYCLDMFPYPSGTGLHVGHWRGYVLSDVCTRYKTLQGYNVLHPMGWDAFGLPAENDAIKKKIHPRVNTLKNIDNIKRQLKEIGAMYNWDREFSTTDPDYYKWTQWIFVQMFKKGLAYKKEMPINWCPSCKTGLANEEVINGGCERCGAEVDKRSLSQWMLKITEYADRLLSDLDKLDWPEQVKLLQRNWIGKSEGGDIVFTAISAKDGSEQDFTVYTTRPDTLFGATYVVFSPEHPMVLEICAPEKEQEIKDYIEWAARQTDIDRTNAKKDKTGVFTGAYAINPVNEEKVPIWISDYVLMGYGTGAIMAVPAHDERDFDFATKFEIPIIEVIHSDKAIRNEDGTLKEAHIDDGKLINSGGFNGMDWEDAKNKIVKMLEEKNKGKKAINYKMRDWIFSRQRYWGEPIPVVHCEKCGWVAVPEDQLPVTLPEVESYEPTGTGESPLAAISEWVNTTCPECGGPAERETDTMPQWAGSSWYFLRYPDPKCDTAIAKPELLDEWMPVDLYVGGIEHAILHLLYARFFTKFLFDIGVTKFDEPFNKLFNQGMICRHSEKTDKVEKMSKSKGNVVSPDEIVEQYGTDTLRLYELFVGPPESESEWSDRSIEGIFRFLKRAWRWVLEAGEKMGGTDDEDILRQRHVLIKNCTERLETFKFNTIISGLMEFINYVSEEKNSQKPVSKETVETFLILISPLAPHFAEELWQEIGNKETVFKQKWPGFDEELTKEDTLTIVVQIKGKVRAKFEAPVGASKEELEKTAMSIDKIKQQLEGKDIKKIIVVPDKLVNIVAI